MRIRISDPTLRDGSHAIGHRLTAVQIAAYAKLADAARIPIVEVGHGNGLGASSLQVGESLLSDGEMLAAARERLKHGKLGVHAIPGFATVRSHLRMAADAGVDVFRIAAHCTEADITRKHIEFIRGAGKEAYGVLMMCHMAAPGKLAEEAVKMQSYGAHGVVIMDSAGALVPHEVTERIAALTDKLDIDVGFHAHNNLGLAVANSVAAVQAGATIVDGTARGFGAGAGNAQLEVLVAVLEKLGYETGIGLFPLLGAAEEAEKTLVRDIPSIDSISLVSGLAGVFSGFKKHVLAMADRYGIDPKELLLELGRRNVVAGQEDLIIESALRLKNAADGMIPGDGGDANG